MVLKHYNMRFCIALLQSMVGCWAWWRRSAGRYMRINIILRKVVKQTFNILLTDLWEINILPYLTFVFLSRRRWMYSTLEKYILVSIDPGKPVFNAPRSFVGVDGGFSSRSSSCGAKRSYWLHEFICTFNQPHAHHLPNDYSDNSDDDDDDDLPAWPIHRCTTSLWAR